MRKIINPETGLLAVGVLQPASASEIAGFISATFPDSGSTPSADQFSDFLLEQTSARRVAVVESDVGALYSLTFLGSHYIKPELRKTRDKFRAYLLRDAHRARFITSREADDESVGASPTLDTSSGIKGRASNKLVRPAGGLRFAHGRAYWPRIQGQFSHRTGLTRRSRDNFPSLISFENRADASAAMGHHMHFDHNGLSVCVGISAQMIWNIYRDSTRHYRTFEIAKRGGGTRPIQSPRVFLKVLQWFLSDFLFPERLKTHAAVHSFSHSKSIATNARLHEGRQFVGNVDINNFFGSVTDEMLFNHLRDLEFSQREAQVLASLCTNQGVLPQGAPSSPAISNSILFSVDAALTTYCDSNGLRYSRYADDITISGGSRRDVSESLRVAASVLQERGLRLNPDKTRVASQGGQQKVTGIVVNSAAAPSRAFRRRARALFHQAEIRPDIFIERIGELGGIIGFLQMFPKLQHSAEIANYKRVLDLLKNYRRERTQRAP